MGDSLALNIVVAGDSVSFGYSDEHGDGGWCGRLNRKLASEFGTFAGNAKKDVFFPLFNLSVPGVRSFEIFQRIAMVIDRQPNLLILNCGLNDIVKRNGEEVPEQALEWVFGIWHYILQSMQLASVKALVIALPLVDSAKMPFYPDKTTRYEWDNAAIEKYNMRLRQICAETGAVFCGLSSYVPSTMAAGGIHPNASGYDVIADDVFKTLNTAKLLSRESYLRSMNDNDKARIMQGLHAVLQG